MKACYLARIRIPLVASREGFPALWEPYLEVHGTEQPN